MAADQPRRAARHRRDVERPAHPPDETLGERRAPTRDLVEVAARQRRVAGMEALVGGHRGEQVDVRRKRFVHLVDEPRDVEPGAHPKMRDLTERVHTGVGAPRAADLDRSPRRAFERAPQLARHGARVLLLLPAAVAGSLVLETQAEARHGEDLRTARGAVSGYTPGTLSLLDRLARNEHFAHFSAEHLARLVEGIDVRHVPRETYVLRQGDMSCDAFLIEKGGIRIQRASPYGQFAIAILARGELFGEASFVDAHPRSGDAFTTSETTLATLVYDRLAPRLDEDPLFATALYWTFWRGLSAKLRRTNEKIGRFFSQAGPTPPGEGGPARPPSGTFRIDLRAKRDLFSEQKLSSLEINLLSSLSRERKLRPGEMLFCEGDPGDAMYVVLEGRVRISKVIAGVGEEALAILGRGDYFGEMALIDRQPRSADAKAHDSGGAVVLQIPKEVVEGLLDIHKVSAVRLLMILCALVSKRLREIDDKLITWYILAGGNVPEIR